MPRPYTIFGILPAFAASILFFAAQTAKTQTCVLTPLYAYKAPNSSAVYYITEQCTKRAFTNAAIFLTYFPSWGSVEATSVGALKNTPTDPLGFMPYGPLYDPKYGALVKTVDDSKVYLLLGGEKYWITSESVFNALKYQWNWIEDIDKRLLDKYQIGSEITETDRHPNFMLIKYAGSPKVYRLEDEKGVQVKRHITDEAVFAKLGFRLDRIVIIPTSESYPDGASLTESDVSPVSTIPTPKPIVKTDCVKNPNPVFSHKIVDPNNIVNILPPPNIAKTGSALKTHSYIDTDALGIPIYAPVDMALIDGAHYIGGPYSLDFRVSCEVTLRMAHIDPVQKIKDALPKEAKENSATVFLDTPVPFKAGEVVAYVYRDVGVLNTGLDFGVYHTERPNKYAKSENPEFTKSSIYTTAVCPYDFFAPELKASYRSKYNLLVHGGMTKDGASFCE